MLENYREEQQQKIPLCYSFMRRREFSEAYETGSSQPLILLSLNRKKSYLLFILCLLFMSFAGAAAAVNVENSRPRRKKVTGDKSASHIIEEADLPNSPAEMIEVETPVHPPICSIYF